MTTNSGGRRAGSRRGARPKRRFRPAVLFYAIASLILLIAWGVLVWMAVGFGGDARDGHSSAWGKLGIAAVVAMLCLFGVFVLIGRLWRALTGEPPMPDDQRRDLPRSGGAYVEEQGYYDPAPGYDPQGYDTGTYPAYDYNPYDTGSQSAYNTGNTGSYPSYGVGGNQLPPRHTPASFQPPSTQPPTLPPGGGQGYLGDGHATGSHSTGDYPTGDYPTGEYTTGSAGSHSNGAYDTGSYNSRSYDTGSYNTGSYSTGSYSAPSFGGARSGELGSGTAAYGTGTFRTPGGHARTPAPGASPTTPPPVDPPTQGMPAVPPRRGNPPSLPAPRQSAPQDAWPEADDQWPPDPPPTYRR